MRLSPFPDSAGKWELGGLGQKQANLPSLSLRSLPPGGLSVFFTRFCLGDAQRLVMSRQKPVPLRGRQGNEVAAGPGEGASGT